MGEVKAIICTMHIKKHLQIYLVTGGYYSNSNSFIDLTELSVNEGAWQISPTGNLRQPTFGLRGISFDNKLFITGRVSI